MGTGVAEGVIASEASNNGLTVRIADSAAVAWYSRGQHDSRLDRRFYATENSGRPVYPTIIMMCVVGAYTINYGIISDAWTLLIFGVFGYITQKIGIQLPPLIIGSILGKSAEVYRLATVIKNTAIKLFLFW